MTRTGRVVQLGWIAAAIGATVGGCMVGPNYKRPETAAPANWSGLEVPATQPSAMTTQPATQPATPGPTTGKPIVAWWRLLKDPMLDSLLQRAIESNLDLRIATARVRQARAARGVVAADLWPQIGGSADYNYRGSSLNTGSPGNGQPSLGNQAAGIAGNAVARSIAAGTAIDPAAVAATTAGQLAGDIVSRRFEQQTKPNRQSNLFQAGFDASWEIDVFGGLRRSVEAAQADYEAAEDNRRAVVMSLLSEVSLDYVQLRGLQRRLDIALENIVAQQESVELTTEKFQAGFAAKLDVSEARAQLAGTQSQVPALESAIRQTIYQLSVLLALPPGALVAELSKEAPIPANVPEVPIGLPSELLRRRPDIQVAERQLAAATARIGVATADLFPRFSLNGGFGSASRDFRHLLDTDSLTWSLGPSVSWPVFQGGRILSNIQGANAVQEEAMATYEQTVLVAFQEVENALVQYINEQDRREWLTDAVEAAQESSSLSQELYSRGLTAFLNVIESQRALYTAQDQLVQSETAVITDLIALYKALGGGWEVFEPVGKSN